MTGDPTREDAPAKAEVHAFFDRATSSVQYIVADPSSGKCAIIDPVLDFEPSSGSMASTSADMLLEYVESNKFELQLILDTHLHADHVSAASYLKFRTGASTAIGSGIVEVQKHWAEFYGLPASFPRDGSQWDRLFRDGEHCKIGHLDVEALFSPGHTPASVTYVVGDAAFVHDTLFMPDGGTARADFPGGDPRELWRTIQRILALPDDTRLFTGHDYQPGGREPRWESSVREQKAANLHVLGLDENEFVRLRSGRDRTLSMPKLMLAAVQMNIACGSPPLADETGMRFLKIPLGRRPLPGGV